MGRAHVVDYAHRSGSVKALAPYPPKGAGLEGRPVHRAALRLGFPSCKKCERVATLEHVSVFGDDPNGLFYIGLDLCSRCAEEHREAAELLDRANKLNDELSEITKLVRPLLIRSHQLLTVATVR